MMSLPKFFKKSKLLLFSGIVLGLLLVFASQANAFVSIKPPPTGTQAPPPSYKIDTWEPAVYYTEEMNQQSFSNETIMAVSASITDLILGCVNCPPEYQARGAVHSLSNLIAGMYANPPASSVEYFADVGRNLGIFAKPAYAQGIGFEGLSPILPIWKAFRNIAYLFFVIVFVFIGFAIMFRVKIDPQTVITIQNALPKLVLALILVTFSYAIAGFLIDLIYVFISLLFALLGSLLAESGSSITSMQDLLGRNVFGAFWYTLGGIRSATAVGSKINDIMAALFTGIPGLPAFIGLLATLIFAVAIAFSLFKLFFILLMSYITIIVGVIFSPFVLMLEALPGQRGLSSWLKMMLSNIIVFPLTAAIFMLGVIITWGFETGKGGWVAPFLGSGWGAADIAPLIALGIVLLAPSIVDSVKKAIGAPGIGAGMMAPLAGAGAVIAAPIRFVTSPIIEASQKERGAQMAEKLKLPGYRGKE